MKKQIFILNSAMTGILQSSNSGSSMIDAGKSALLASKIKKILIKNGVDVEVKAIDEDMLKEADQQETLILINKKVQQVVGGLEIKNAKVIIYDVLDITKEGFGKFIAKISAEIKAN